MTFSVASLYANSKLLVLDNYDSFTYNLVHLLRDIGVAHLDVFRNDKISVQEAQSYDKIVLSPGPGIPEEAGNMLDIIKACANTTSILGVCLGHQAIAEAFGGTLFQMAQVMHGRETPISLLSTEDPLFAGISSPFLVGRYHSWAVQRNNLPDCLVPTAEDEHGILMALCHKTLRIWGVQFHPESVMTPAGKRMLQNWLSL